MVFRSNSGSGGARYLAVEFYSDTYALSLHQAARPLHSLTLRFDRIVHFEVSGVRDFPSRSTIYTTQMVGPGAGNFSGPSSLTRADTSSAAVFITVMITCLACLHPLRGVLMVEDWCFCSESHSRGGELCHAQRAGVQSRQRIAAYILQLL